MLNDLAAKVSFLTKGYITKFILSILDQTHNTVININDNFWALSTHQDDKKNIHNLFAIQLYHHPTFSMT